ncbi:MAG TPA: thioesterase family protein [Puia sp.]|nr:thioesterase family protein [Puia sp.]
MARIKIDLPKSFSFSIQIPVRITDLNYGGHVGNDNILSIMHEARVQFLQHHGFDEMNLAGVGLIMSDVSIEYKAELFYGDTITALVTAGEFSKIGFDLFYKLEKTTAGKQVTVVLARTGMVCYNYELKKIVAVPEKAIQILGKTVGS